MKILRRITYPPDGQPGKNCGLHVSRELDGGAVLQKIPDHRRGKDDKRDGAPRSLRGYRKKQEDMVSTFPKAVCRKTREISVPQSCSG